MDRKRHAMMRPAVILSRLVAMLALALFALPPGQADSSVTQTGSAAQSLIDQSHGIVSVQRHLPRAQLTDDDTPDLAEQFAAVSAPYAPVTLRSTASESASLVHSALRILPPVRAPPAV